MERIRKNLKSQLKTMLKSELKKGLEELLIHTKEYVRIAEELKITNEQFFIDWEMNMSYLVTQDHNCKIKI